LEAAVKKMEDELAQSGAEAGAADADAAQAESQPARESSAPQAPSTSQPVKRKVSNTTPAGTSDEAPSAKQAQVDAPQRTTRASAKKRKKSESGEHEAAFESDNAVFAPGDDSGCRVTPRAPKTRSPPQVCWVVVPTSTSA
jgi:hypothetical protein